MGLNTKMYDSNRIRTSWFDTIKEEAISILVEMLRFFVLFFFLFQWIIHIYLLLMIFLPNCLSWFLTWYDTAYSWKRKQNVGKHIYQIKIKSRSWEFNTNQILSFKRIWIFLEIFDNISRTRTKWKTFKGF